MDWRGHLDSRLAGADSPNRRPGAAAERGAHQRHRPLSRISGRSGRRRGTAAGARAGIGHLHQCADLYAAVRVADQGAVRPRRRRLACAAPRAVARLRRHLVDHARGGADIRVLLSMTVLVGAASFFVGNAYQAQMPGFARDLGHGRADLSYSLLLAADAAGGLMGG